MIDDFMPIYDMRERHQISIQATAQHIYDVMFQANIFRSRMVYWLFSLRRLPRRWREPETAVLPPELSINTLLDSGFICLSEKPSTEFLMGVIMSFRAVDLPQLADAPAFHDFNTPGFVKSVMGFFLEPQPGDRTRLATETRVFCLDEESRRRFRPYWFFIGPFSGLIRRLMLGVIKRGAEK